MASKKRGLSIEEKRTRMLEIFYGKKDFFLLKELEKIGPKEKGIVSQSVKDVVQSLVDDNLVDTDKIGTSVYFWAFPSKATAARQGRLQELQVQSQALAAKIQEKESGVARDTIGREPTDERTEALRRWKELQGRRDQLEAQVRKHRNCDPKVMEEMRSEIKASHEAANRWTDNIYSLQSWIGRKFPSVAINDLNKQFGVPEDLDYIVAEAK